MGREIFNTVDTPVSITTTLFIGRKGRILLTVVRWVCFHMLFNSSLVSFSVEHRSLLLLLHFLWPHRVTSVIRFIKTATWLFPTKELSLCPTLNLVRTIISRQITTATRESQVYFACHRWALEHVYIFCTLMYTWYCPTPWTNIVVLSIVVHLWQHLMGERTHAKLAEFSCWF